MTFDDPRAREIHRRLQQIGEGPPAFFADAYTLIEGDLGLQTTSHLAGHALRELESSVRAVLAMALEVSGSHEQEVRGIADALGGDQADTLADAWWALELHGLAHRDQLRRPRPVDQGLREKWTKWVDILSVLLDRFEATYSTVFRRLDALLQEEYPTRDQLNQVARGMPHTPAAASHFFTRLEALGWFDGLSSRGVFRHPPAPIEDTAAGTVRFPDWPQGMYLRRMAPRRPEAIAEILSNLESDNPRVQETVVSIALALPAQYRCQVAPRIVEWIPGLRRMPWFGEDVLAFLQSLGDGDCVEHLEAGVRALLEPTDEEEWHGPRKGRVPWILQERAPLFFGAMAACLGGRLLRLISEALDARLERQWRRSEDTEEPVEDHSVSWSPNLDTHAPHRRDAWPSFLVFHIREASDALVRQGIRAGEVAGMLTASPWMVYRRLELDLLARHASEEADLVGARLSDADLWCQGSLSTEMAALLKNGFRHLDATKQNAVLQALWTGPEFEWVHEGELREKWRRAWVRDRLALIEQELSGEWLERLEGLRESDGEAHDPTRRTPSVAMAIGPRSPRSADELAGMQRDEMVAFLQEWRPEGTDPFEPDASGLAASVREMVASAPDEASRWAPMLADVPLRYVASALSGFREAIRQTKAIEWGPLLDLCTAVVERTEPLEENGDGRSVWARSARISLLHLLDDGLRSDGAIPVEDLPDVWGIVQTLASDPDPDGEDRQDLPDPSAIALNSVRPMALSVAVAYGRAQFNHLVQRDGEGVVPAELLELLAEHLEEPSASHHPDRAAIGKALGTLVAMDRAWVEAHIHLLAPEDAEAAGAVFDAYLRYGCLDGESLSVLTPVYRAAIARASAAGEGADMYADVEESLAVHLMNGYWWGQLEIADDGALLPHFFREASASSRRHALHTVGWSLCNGDEPPEQGVLARLRHLWAWRAQTLRHGELSADDRAELVEFGWWMAARVFDVEWALAELAEVLRVTQNVEWAREVSEYLVDLFVEHAAPVLEAVALLDPTGGPEPWRIHEWKENVTKILRSGLARDEPAIHDRAKELVNRWVAVGHTDLMELLGPEDRPE